MKTVGIIGGAGFIGSYVTKRFLDENFRIRVSSTDITNRGKYDHLYTLANAGNLTVCPLDLQQPDTIDTFVAGCDIIIHAGTPFLLDVKDPEKELFEPTLTGTQNFLAVLQQAVGLESVVFVASVAAWNTSFPHNPPTQPGDHVFSENDTPYFGENDHPYARAKFMADQTVRQFISDNPDLAFAITTVSPVMVVGNSLSDRQDSTSMGLQYLFRHKIAPNPFVEMLFATDVRFSMVDVRDVADCIFQAATQRGLHGRNYLLANQTYAVSDITRMLNRQAPVSAPAQTYDNALARQELGVSFIPAEETLFTCN